MKLGLGASLNSPVTTQVFCLRERETWLIQEWRKNLLEGSSAKVRPHDPASVALIGELPRITQAGENDLESESDKDLESELKEVFESESEEE